MVAIGLPADKMRAIARVDGRLGEREMTPEKVDACFRWPNQC